MTGTPVTCISTPVTVTGTQYHLYTLEYTEMSVGSVQISTQHSHDQPEHWSGTGAYGAPVLVDAESPSLVLHWGIPLPPHPSYVLEDHPAASANTKKW